MWARSGVMVTLSHTCHVAWWFSSSVVHRCFHALVGCHYAACMMCIIFMICWHQHELVLVLPHAQCILEGFLAETQSMVDDDVDYEVSVSRMRG